MKKSEQAKKMEATIIERYGSLKKFHSMRQAKRKKTLIDTYGEDYQKGFGLEAAATNKMRYGNDFYNLIGREGGIKSRGGGVTGDPKRAAEIGSIGGRASR